MLMVTVAKDIIYSVVWSQVCDLVGRYTDIQWLAGQIFLNFKGKLLVIYKNGWTTEKRNSRRMISTRGC